MQLHLVLQYLNCPLGWSLDDPQHFHEHRIFRHLEFEIFPESNMRSKFHKKTIKILFYVPRVLVFLTTDYDILTGTKTDISSLLQHRLCLVLVFPDRLILKGGRGSTCFNILVVTTLLKILFSYLNQVTDCLDWKVYRHSHDKVRTHYISFMHYCATLSVLQDYEA